MTKSGAKELYHEKLGSGISFYSQDDSTIYKARTSCTNFALKLHVVIVLMAGDMTEYSRQG